MDKKAVYKVGEEVVINGLYVCVPCGYKKKFVIGDTFPQCLDCMRTSKPIADVEYNEAKEQGVEVNEFDEGAFAPNLETWELIKEA